MAEARRAVGASISIHALREEGDGTHARIGVSACIFLSTPSARRATYLYAREIEPWKFLSTPSARRATSFVMASLSDAAVFLSTPSARRATFSIIRMAPPVGVFLSTPSARRATCAKIRKAQRQDISIHALREEGDSVTAWLLLLAINFYPRPPRGGRPKRSAEKARNAISIHALREEGDGAFC